MRSVAKKVAGIGLLPPWVFDVLERRRDWVMARTAIREDQGANAWYDAREAEALSVVLEISTAQKPLAEAVFGIEIELHNLRQQNRKAQKCLAMHLRQQRRIAQLKAVMREHGLIVPREVSPPQSSNPPRIDGVDKAPTPGPLP